LEVTIYHNPRCSKSRQTLKLLEENGISPKVIDYLVNPPDLETIKSILELLEYSPRQLLRAHESEYNENNLSDESLSDVQVIQAMISAPKLIERPIVVVNNEKAAIGRPPENILKLIN